MPFPPLFAGSGGGGSSSATIVGVGILAGVGGSDTSSSAAMTGLGIVQGRSGTGTELLLAAGLLPVPVWMGGALDSVVVLPTWSYNPVQGSPYSANAALATLADALAALKGRLSLVQVVLYTNGLAPTPQTQLADLVQPTASWYAPVLTSLGSAYLLPDGTLGLTAASAEWDYSGSSPGAWIVGWGLMGTFT